MAADIVPVRLGLTKGDLYTCGLHAGAMPATNGRRSSARTRTSTRSSRWPTWSRSSGPTPTTTWPTTRRGTPLTEANAHRFDPAEDRQYDLVGVARGGRREAHRGVGRRRCTARWRSCRPSDRCASCRRSPSSSTATRCSAPGRWRRRLRGPSRPQAVGRDRGGHRPQLGRRARRDRRDRHHPRRRLRGGREGRGRAGRAGARARGGRGRGGVANRTTARTRRTRTTDGRGIRRPDRAGEAAGAGQRRGLLGSRSASTRCG